MPNAYRPKSTAPACAGKNTPAISMYTGSLALHDMNGLMSTVIMRLLRLSIVREAMIAGTLHPNPMIRGMNDLPCRPMQCIILSIMNAALAMYPESSMNDMHRKSIRILGRNTITPPTPPMMPSTIRSLRAPSGIVLPMSEPKASTPASIQPIG